MVESEVVLAALLHDIGKFWQRSGVKERHQELSRLFIGKIDFSFEIDTNLISSLVFRHHDNKNLPIDFRVSGLENGNIERCLARIVSDADNISSTINREEDDEGEASHPLISIFSEVNTSINDKIYYYKPGLLSTTIHPETDICDLTSITDNNWNKFIEDAKLIGKNSKNFNIFFHNIYYLLKRHTSLVPSNGYKTTSDIPLFDHLKTSSAIALCLYRWRKENKSGPSNKTDVYLLIEGDLSGIQRFIFQISSPVNARIGMSKRLRGRSFWLTLMMDAVAAGILKELNLPETNLLWNTGGHFIILAPNLEEYINKLEKIRKKVNTELLNEYDGNLFIGLNWIKCSADDLQNFTEIKNKLSLKINIVKQQKFIDSPLNFGTDGENRKIEEYCVVCSTFKEEDMWFRIENDWRKWKGESDVSLYCSMCKKHEKLGKKLAKAEYIVRGIKSEFDLFGIGYEFINKDELNSILSKYEDIVVYKLNNTDFVDADIYSRYPNAKLCFKFIGNTVPIDNNGNVFSFEYISQMSKGANKLGVLKADVDNLGKIFTSGLKSDNRSISRIHAMSSMLELFFAGQLNEISGKYSLFELCKSCEQKSNRIVHIREKNGMEKYTYHEANIDDLCSECKKKKINKLYITYSGGDDLLIIGPYDAIIDAALEIRTQFKKFVCENPEINISSGIAVVNPHYPVARTVIRADEQLELAKSHMIHGITKNNIAIFNECMRWDETKTNQIMGFETVLNIAKKLEDRVEEKEIKKKKLSKGFIYSLLKMWHLTFGDLRTLEDVENTRGSGHIIRRRYMPYLKYQLVRNIHDKDERFVVENMIKPCMSWIRISVSWVSLRTRR